MIKTDISQAIFNQLNSIAGLENKIFPLNAPKETATPYLIFTAGRNDEEYTLNGVTNNHNIVFDINIYSHDLPTLEDTGVKTRSKLLSLFGATIEETYHIQSVKYAEQNLYEEPVNLYRKIIEFEIYF